MDETEVGHTEIGCECECECECEPDFEKEPDIECPICAFVFNDEYGEVFTTDCCKQQLHKKCFDNSLQSCQCMCPFCRTIHKNNIQSTAVNHTVIVINNQVNPIYVSDTDASEQILQLQQCTIRWNRFIACMCCFFTCVILVSVGILLPLQMGFNQYRLNQLRGIYLHNLTVANSINLTNFTIM